MLFEDKAAADAYVEGPLRDQIVGLFNDVVDGMNSTEFDVVVDLSSLTR